MREALHVEQRVGKSVQSCHFVEELSNLHKVCPENGPDLRRDRCKAGEWLRVGLSAGLAKFTTVHSCFTSILILWGGRL